MGMGMGVMMLVWLVVVVVLGLAAVRLVARQLPSASKPDEDRLLANQAEQIEELQDELRRVKEQAEFTEKLLTERHDSEEDAPEEGPRD